MDEYEELYGDDTTLKPQPVPGVVTQQISSLQQAQQTEAAGTVKLGEFKSFKISQVPIKTSETQYQQPQSQPQVEQLQQQQQIHQQQYQQQQSQINSTQNGDMDLDILIDAVPNQERVQRVHAQQIPTQQSNLSAQKPLASMQPPTNQVLSMMQQQGVNRNQGAQYIPAGAGSIQQKPGQMDGQDASWNWPSKATPSQLIKLPRQTRVAQDEYKEFLALGHGDIFDLNLDQVMDIDAMWRQPGVDPSDFFNYAMTEKSWKEYQRQIQRYRQEFMMQHKIETFDGGDIVGGVGPRRLNAMGIEPYPSTQKYTQVDNYPENNTPNFPMIDPDLPKEVQIAIRRELERAQVPPEEEQEDEEADDKPMPIPVFDVDSIYAGYFAKKFMRGRDFRRFDSTYVDSSIYLEGGEGKSFGVSVDYDPPGGHPLPPPEPKEEQNKSGGHGYQDGRRPFYHNRFQRGGWGGRGYFGGYHNYNNQYWQRPYYDGGNNFWGYNEGQVFNQNFIDPSMMGDMDYGFEQPFMEEAPGMEMGGDMFGMGMLQHETQLANEFATLPDMLHDNNNQQFQAPIMPGQNEDMAYDKGDEPYQPFERGYSGQKRGYEDDVDYDQYDDRDRDRERRYVNHDRRYTDVDRRYDYEEEEDDFRTGREEQYYDTRQRFDYEDEDVERYSGYKKRVVERGDRYDRYEKRVSGGRVRERERDRFDDDQFEWGGTGGGTRIVRERDRSLDRYQRSRSRGGTEYRNVRRRYE